MALDKTHGVVTANSIQTWISTCWHTTSVGDTLRISRTIAISAGTLICTSAFSALLVKHGAWYADTLVAARSVLTFCPFAARPCPTEINRLASLERIALVAFSAPTDRSVLTDHTGCVDAALHVRLAAWIDALVVDASFVRCTAAAIFALTLYAAHKAVVRVTNKTLLTNANTETISNRTLRITSVADNAFARIQAVWLAAAVRQTEEPVIAVSVSTAFKSLSTNVFVTKLVGWTVVIARTDGGTLGIDALFIRQTSAVGVTRNSAQLVLASFTQTTLAVNLARNAQSASDQRVTVKTVLAATHSFVIASDAVRI